MKPLRWGSEKNAQLAAERGVSFEHVAVALASGGLLDIVEHPHPSRYPNLRILVVAWGGYVYLVPFVEQADHYFLKTIIPSRKATRDYLTQGDSDDEA